MYNTNKWEIALLWYHVHFIVYSCHCDKHLLLTQGSSCWNTRTSWESKKYQEARSQNVCTSCNVLAEGLWWCGWWVVSVVLIAHQHRLLWWQRTGWGTCSAQHFQSGVFHLSPGVLGASANFHNSFHYGCHSQIMWTLLEVKKGTTKHDYIQSYNRYCGSPL